MKSTTKITRGAAIRAQKRTQEDAARVLSPYENKTTQKQPSKPIDQLDKLKITFLGGLNDVGEKNMAIIEWQNDAIVLDCGMNLSVDLPGVNYEINDTAYLESIKHKIKAYVITHGHLDHIGGLRHTVPACPAPIYGAPYTIGIIKKSFADELSDTAEDFQPNLVTANPDTHERLKLGSFFIEFIRVTHAIPDATAVCIDTPVGRIIATGDFKLDPEPLDNLPTDKSRLKELGDQGVLLLLSESSYVDVEGRTPTEHTLQKSFHDIITTANGRVFAAVFSSNINRTQMIINAAAASGRKVALDGRSMLAYAEIAVKQGVLKVPKGTIVPMSQTANLPPNQLLVICTGGQGEPNAALQRMSDGQHKYVNLNPGDTVIVSSSPIPGNELAYDALGNKLSKKGVHLFRHPTHQIDGCGPLHVSGHGKRDELREMIQLVRPKFFIPVHGGRLRRTYHAELAVQEGIPRGHVLLPDNGNCLLLTANSIESAGSVPHSGLLVDQTGGVISNLVIRDRLMLAEEGIVTIILTIDKKSGQLLTSPDIVSRGFIAMKDNTDLMTALRDELRRATSQRFKRIDLDRFKTEIRDHVTHFLFEHTQRSPIIIPVVNVTGNKTNQAEKRPAEVVAHEQQKRFQAMRARLLGQDQTD